MGLGDLTQASSSRSLGRRGATDLETRRSYNQPEDWIFASTWKRGKQPYSPDSILKRCIRPAAARAKITKHIGWHTFRRTFSTLLKANGEDIKVVPELLRHATVKMTLEVYAQAITPAKRNAQSKVVGNVERGRNEAKILIGPSGDFAKPISC